MRKQGMWVALAVLGIAWLPSQAQVTDRVQLPHQVIEQESADLLAAMEGRRDYLAEHPDDLHAIVDSVLRPNFDVKYAARLILARHWSKATAEERARFIEALYGSLVRRYSMGLLKHTETTVRVTPPRLGYKTPVEEFETVKTVVVMDDGTEVPVHYEMRFADQVWKAYDVKIEGRSYVAYYRETIGTDIRDKGLDTAIRTLETS